MFPQFLAIVAIYLMFATITDLWPAIGFNTPWGLILLYLGGALGVNTWLMKGFFDTIPKDLDESAKVDGATHSQIFFGIILPLVAPILAITGLLAFIGTINEFLIASIFLTDRDAKTAAVGLRGLLPAATGTPIRDLRRPAPCDRDPDGAVFQFLQRYIVGGLTAGAVKGIGRRPWPGRPGRADRPPHYYKVSLMGEDGRRGSTATHPSLRPSDRVRPAARRLDRPVRQRSAADQPGDALGGGDPVADRARPLRAAARRRRAGTRETCDEVGASRC